MEIRRRKLEADHPALVSSLEAVGQLRHALGDLDAALTLHERVLELRQRKDDTPPPDIARALLNLAQVHAARGDHKRALDFARDADAMFEQTLGRAHPEAALYLNMLAQLQRSTDPETAQAQAEQALALSLQTRDPRHPILATSHRILGALSLDRGEYAEADAALRQGRTIAAAALGPKAPELAAIDRLLTELASRRAADPGADAPTPAPR